MDEKLIVWQLEIPEENNAILGLYRTADGAKHYVGDFENEENVTWKSRTTTDDLLDSWYCETDDGDLWYIIYPIEVL
jgi:hypothetical protein